MKNANQPQWTQELVFEDESLTLKKIPRRVKLPPLLEQARDMQFENAFESPQKIFLKQGRMLADYEDDYRYLGDPVRYYPTYQSLTDAELRGYFTWRTGARKGEPGEPPLTFVFLHAYELINNIGVASPEEGYDRLLELRRRHGPENYRVEWLLDRWLRDYVIYYGLDAKLLGEDPQIASNQCLTVIERIAEAPRDDVLDAIKQLAPKWLRRSKFYAANFEDMDEIIYRVFKKMSAHYARGHKRTFVEQYFGRTMADHIHLFSSAIFCNPLERENYEYRIDSQHCYKCEAGVWSVNIRQISPRGLRKVEDLLKSIDSFMRLAYAYNHPVKCENSTKWVTSLIQEEIAGFLAEKAAARQKKLVIDFSSLARIRADAAQTRDRLIVEEEAALAP
ncbi:MAG: hypothetical protein HDQ91_06650, partial [Desulfovibrio sp.]|nr:hypothetical protein [Desulfovibrio sp.]